MGKVFNVLFFAALITLFSPILCRSSHHDHHHDTNFLSYIPGIGILMKNFTIDDSTVDQQITGKPSEFQGENSVSESSTPEVLMEGDRYNDDYGNSSKSVVVGVPIGGIILFILICYCCYRCFCRPRVVVQGATIIRTPPPQPQGQVPIVIQNVTNTPVPTQYPPPYHPNYEMGHPPQPMKQWNQVNQHSPPPQPYYGEPNAPPQYGRY